MNWTDAAIKGKILHKLTRADTFEHSHTAIKHLQKGFPKDMTGRVKGMVKALVKEGILKPKPTGHGMQAAINLQKSDAVQEYIQTFLEQ